MPSTRAAVLALLPLTAVGLSSAIAVPGPIANYFGRFRDGVQGQFNSFQECQRIRKKRKLEPEDPITFAEHQELKQGVDDRWKIISLGVWYNFSPEMVTFFVIFPAAWPGWMPSRFQSQENIQGKVNDAGRKRIWDGAQAIRKLDEKLYKMQKQENPNRPEGTPPNKKRVALQASVDTLGKAFQANSKEATLAELLHLYPSGEPGPLDLSKLPAPLVNAACKCVGIEGFLTPGFMKRGKLMQHLKHVKAGDDALSSSSQELSPKLLDLACMERCIGSPKVGEDTLKSAVKEHLTLAQTYEKQHDPLGVRLALLGANTIEAVRIAPEADIFRTFFTPEAQLRGKLAVATP